jgi:hypothetical protein
MSKYDPLWKYLQNDGSHMLRLTFEEINCVLGFPIGHSFLTHKKEAAEYGYQVGKISMKEQLITFNKISDNELIKNIGLLHTTELGVKRIKQNLELTTDDVIDWCKQSILSSENITKKGKNWYVYTNKSVITVNVYSYTIITAHKN